MGGALKSSHSLSRLVKVLHVLALVLMASGAAVVAEAVPASAAVGTLTLSPSTGVMDGTVLTVTGSGFSHSSIGNLLECNSDPSQPTVALAAPISTSISVGCTPPTFAKLVVTSATGTISTTWTVVGPTVGPPCGPAPDIVTCPATDSAGNSPATDAALYPCPPTASQQAAGDVCQLNYGDSAGDSATANIGFPTATTTTTAATTTTTGPTTTTTGATTTTTSATTTTTSASTTTTGATTTTTGATTTTSLPATPTTEECQPGWGLGDKNHCHSGPPGRHHHHHHGPPTSPPASVSATTTTSAGGTTTSTSEDLGPTTPSGQAPGCNPGRGRGDTKSCENVPPGLGTDFPGHGHGNGNGNGKWSFSNVSHVTPQTTSTWALLVGAVLVVLGMAVLALVDFPRRLLSRVAYAHPRQGTRDNTTTTKQLATRLTDRVVSTTRWLLGR